MATKACSKCGKVKELSEFRPRKDVAGGRRAQCKSCMNAHEHEARVRREERKPGA